MNYVFPDLGGGAGVHLIKPAQSYTGLMEKNRVHVWPLLGLPHALTWSVGGFFSLPYQAGFPIGGQM